MRCDNMERGCRWTGTIATLDNHIATCQFALVPCPNKCEESAGELQFMRKDLDNHLKTKCPKRTYECQHCGVKGSYASVAEDHDKGCNKKIVPCPNKGRGCPLSMERGKTKQHVMSICDNTEVACAYESLGCGVRMLRKDIKNHQENDDKVHVHLVLKSFSSFREEQNILSEDEAFVFKLSGYDRKKENNDKFYSRPFYTSPGGYKMCIGVDANGRADGKGTHVSVSTELLEGHYDDQLHWPFLGTVTFELLNQLADEKHHIFVAVYTASQNVRVGNSSLGHARFLPHSSLSHDPATNTQYLLDDTLYFRVSVNVANHKPWLVCTDQMNANFTQSTIKSISLNDNESIIYKVTDFETKKTANTYCNSYPFSTSPKGYMMEIKFYANGYGSSERTHVSVYVTLLQGSCDTSLSWPFVGSVTLTLLNQLADNNHHSVTVEYELKNNVQVGKGLGRQQFISHSELSHNPIKKTQYLKNNTLYFRVAVKVDDHKPWLVGKHHI